MTLSGKIIDPLNGREDIQQRLLVPCNPESIADDPIRIFRAFRFKAYGWHITPELKSLINSGGWDAALSGIPVERFTREMLKAMKGDQPALFFSQMVEFDVGRCYLAEIFRMQDVPAGPIKYHGEDTVLSHSLDVLRRMAAMTEDPTARLAAMFHDLGKLATPDDMLPRHIGHEQAGVQIARQFADRIRLPVSIRNAIMEAIKLHMVGGRWDDLRITTKLLLAEQARKGGIAEYFPLLVMADRNLGHSLEGWEHVLCVSGLSAAELGIDSEMMGSLAEKDRAPMVHRQRIETLKHRLNRPD